MSKSWEFERRCYEAFLADVGLIDPDQPTVIAHLDYVRSMSAEFTSLERRLIRNELGLTADTHQDKG